MPKPKKDPNARFAGENYFAWQSRLARQANEARDREQPLVTPEAEKHGLYISDFVTHVETNTKAHTKVNRASNIVDKWLDEGAPNFPPGARAAVEHCQRLWEVSPTLGKLTQSYVPPTARGSVPHEHLFKLDAKRELDLLESWFPGPYWRVFENVVRFGQPAGLAGSEMADNAPSAIAMAKATVGLIACHIAAKKGF